MAQEALEKIKRTESDALQIVENAKSSAEILLAEAKKTAEAGLLALSEEIEAESKRSRDAARQMAEAKAAEMIEIAGKTASAIIASAEEKKDGLKSAIFEELIG